MPEPWENFVNGDDMDDEVNKNKHQAQISGFKFWGKKFGVIFQVQILKKIVKDVFYF